MKCKNWRAGDCYYCKKYNAMCIMIRKEIYEGLK